MKQTIIFDRLVQIFYKWVPVLGVVILLAACGPVDRLDVLPTAGTDGSGYPDPLTLSSSESAYPVNSDVNPQLPDATALPGSYPPPVKTAAPFQEPRFRIDLPVSGQSTTMTGQALPNLALAVVDITYNGIVLGTGRSDESGVFSISVTPLPEGHRVGIAIAEVRPGQTFNEMVIELHPHRGEGFMNIPNVGVFFDTVMVQP